MLWRAHEAPIHPGFTSFHELLPFYHFMLLGMCVLVHSREGKDRVDDDDAEETAQQSYQCHAGDYRLR